VTDSTNTEPASRSSGGGLVRPAAQRLRLDIAYDGTAFSGWARQTGKRTVEQTIADALATVLRLGAAPRLVVAGRTDAGVHAAGQVAHVDIDGAVDHSRLCRGLAGVLPADVVVRSVTPAPFGFDARFAAIGRRYRYRVTDGPADPLRRHDTLRWKKPLDPDPMHEAAQGLVGEHDFAAYCRPRPDASTVRHLQELAVQRNGEGVIEVTAAADAFCHNQVRSMVGALLAVGDKRRQASWPREVLAAGVRDSAVTVAPPHGLTLLAVDYPPDDELESRVLTTRARRAMPTVSAAPRRS
jgi:tRNA pseudouridine38-40 synthase